MTEILSVSRLTKSYGKSVVVDKVTFGLRKGEILTLLGHSGCGKSTTLRMIAGLELPDGGAIHLRDKVVASGDGVWVPPEQRNLGLVFQSYAVWPHMTVGENVAYPLDVRGVPRRERRDRVTNICGVVGLGNMIDRPATQLSGGQQQRVALARALVYEPDVLLLDEPFSNLDAKLRDEMRLQLRQIQSRLGTTILYVTHDQAEALALSHRVAVMRNGRIEQLAEPAVIYERPASLFVQEFVGQTVIMDGVVELRQGSIATVRLSDGAMLNVSSDAAVGTAVNVVARPEDIVIAQSPDNCIAAEIVDLAYGGDHFDALIRVSGKHVSIRLEKNSLDALGTQLNLTFPVGKTHIWPM